MIESLYGSEEFYREHWQPDPIKDVPLYKKYANHFDVGSSVVFVEAVTTYTKPGTLGIVTEIRRTDLQRGQYISPFIYGIKASSQLVFASELRVASVHPDKHNIGDVVLLYNNYDPNLIGKINLNTSSTYGQFTRVEIVDIKKHSRFINGQAYLVRRLGRKRTFWANGYNLVKIPLNTSSVFNKSPEPKQTCLTFTEVFPEV